MGAPPWVARIPPPRSSGVPEAGSVPFAYQKCKILLKNLIKNFSEKKVLYYKGGKKEIDLVFKESSKIFGQKIFLEKRVYL